MMMRGAMLALAVPGLLAACSEQPGRLSPEAMLAETTPGTATAQPAVELIASDNLAAMIAAGEVVLIDVRTPEEFAESRIPGALNAPVETFDAASIPIEAERETILYCRSARRSERAALMLAEHIDGTVRHLEGGIIAWEEASGEVISSPAAE